MTTKTNEEIIDLIRQRIPDRYYHSTVERLVEEIIGRELRPTPIYKVGDKFNVRGESYLLAVSMQYGVAQVNAFNIASGGRMCDEGVCVKSLRFTHITEAEVRKILHLSATAPLERVK